MSILTKFLQTREEKIYQHKVCTIKARIPHAGKQAPDSLLNEAIALTSMDDNGVKLTRIVEPNNLHLHLARDGH